MDIINELWYGNVSPFEQCTSGDKRLKETLEKFEDCMNEMHSITECDAVSYGFRLGVQLMAEVFLLPLGEDEEQQPKHRTGIGEITMPVFCFVSWQMPKTP